MTIRRRCTSTWVAARPMPGASYMVSNRSSISLPQRRVELLHRPGAGAQAWVRVFQNG